jgi:hypothetical protein
LITALKEENLWPPIVPTVVVAESTSGAPRTDTNVNRFLKTCEIEPVVSERAARRAGYLRARARTGSAVDALVVAMAEPGGTVLTGDLDDLEALASHATEVAIESV